MAWQWQGKSRPGWRTWAFPAAGFTVALGLSWVPGLPFGAGRWPAGGTFGVFTWSAWFVSTALAVTLGLLGGVLRIRRAVQSRLGRTRRVFLAAFGFAALAVLAYVAAARADLMKRYPLATLGVAVAILSALRGLSLAAARPPDEAGAKVDADAAASRPDPPRAPREGDGDPDDETGEGEPGMPRWASVLATLMASLLVLVVVAVIAVRWLGPGLGLVLTTRHATPIFWSETAFFEYDAVKRAGTDASAYLRPPAPGSADVARRDVLPAGVNLAIKGWVENGAEVRIERDPAGKREGEWGFVRVSDLRE